MTIKKVAAVLLFASFAAGVSHPDLAATAPRNTSGPPWTAEVSVPSSYKIKFDSAINAESYTLFIRVPATPPPPQGYPVIYVLDGDLNFGTAADVELTLNNDPVHAPVVVAIGHGVFGDMDVVRRYAVRKPGDQTPVGIADIGSVINMLRLHDYTLPVAANHLAPAWTGLTSGNIGGLDQFLKVVEAEIKPKVAQLIPVNAANQAIFGHSIGGLAVLRALFTEPGAFRTFIAASPSIWWDADAVLADEASFAKVIESHGAAPRVLITVGADEPDSPNPPQSFINSLPPDKATELTAYVKMASAWSGMISGARDLAARLGRIQGGQDYKVSFVAFAGENHASVIPVALNRGMWFAFGPQ
ncbi:MAG TPA: alpha/beta hydrolase-fold protein [Steroidobacteraceae bacterium]|nr:alpha/beta hydrolase-fold protein [Steroidobacteraceae bacterium]